MLERLLESDGAKIIAEMEETTILLRGFEQERGRLPVDIAEFREWRIGRMAAEQARLAFTAAEQARLALQEAQAPPRPTTPEGRLEELEQRVEKIIAGEGLPGAKDSLASENLSEEVTGALQGFVEEGLDVRGVELFDYLDRAFVLTMKAEGFLEARKEATDEALRGVREVQESLKARRAAAS